MLWDYINLYVNSIHPSAVLRKTGSGCCISLLAFNTSINENWPSPAWECYTPSSQDLISVIINYYLTWHMWTLTSHYNATTDTSTSSQGEWISRYTLQLETKSLNLDFVSNFNHLTHLVKSILTDIWQNTTFFIALFSVVAGYFSPSITGCCISVFWQNIPASPICTICSTSVTLNQQSPVPSPWWSL